MSFHLGHPGERVEVRSLDSLVATGLPAPTFVKIDVEGAEALVLAGARSLLSGANGPRSAPMVLVSVHDPTLQRSSLRALKDMGYAVLGSLGIAAFENGTRPWEGDPDLLGIPPHRGADLDAFRAIPWFAGGAEW